MDGGKLGSGYSLFLSLEVSPLSDHSAVPSFRRVAELELPKNMVSTQSMGSHTTYVAELEPPCNLVTPSPNTERNRGKQPVMEAGQPQSREVALPTLKTPGIVASPP